MALFDEQYYLPEFTLFQGVLVTLYNDHMIGCSTFKKQCHQWPFELAYTIGCSTFKFKHHFRRVEQQQHRYNNTLPESNGDVATLHGCVYICRQAISMGHIHTRCCCCCCCLLLLVYVCVCYNVYTTTTSSSSSSTTTTTTTTPGILRVHVLRHNL